MKLYGFIPIAIGTRLEYGKAPFGAFFFTQIISK